MPLDTLAKILWDYNKLDHPLKKADAIFVLGSHDTRVAEHAAQLFLDGWAPLLIMSGGFGRLTGDWTRPEAEMFAEIAEGMGVPADKIILETASTNTGENIEYTRALLDRQGIHPKNLIVVQKPYMERRAYAAMKKKWPEMDFVVSSSPVPYEEYPNDEISKDELINILVGDTERNKVYGSKGYQIEQVVPDDVWAACEALVSMGYTKYLVPELH